MKLGSYLLLGIISVIFFSGCMILQEEDVVKMAELPKVESQFQPKIAWSTSVGHGTSVFDSNLHPAYKDHTVYVADREGIVEAINVNDGTIKWKINLLKEPTKYRSMLLSGGITADKECIYIGTEYGVIYCINKNKGNVIWENQVIGEVVSSPVVSNDLVLVHTGTGMLQALNKITGITKWIIDLGPQLLSIRGESEPVVSAGNVIIGDDNGYLNFVLLDEGELIWQQRISSQKDVNEVEGFHDVDTPPLINNNIIYALAYNGNLVAININSKKVLWQQEEIGGTKKIIYNKNRLYCVDQNDNVYEINAKNGKIIWKQNNLLHRKLTSPFLFKKYLIFGDCEGYLHWMNIVDGSFVAQQKIDSSGFQADPILVNKDNFIFQSKDGKIYSIIK